MTTSDKTPRSTRGKTGTRAARPKAGSAASGTRRSTPQPVPVTRRPAGGARVSLEDAFTPMPVQVPARSKTVVRARSSARAPAQSGTGLLWGILVVLATLNARLLVALIIRSRIG